MSEKRVIITSATGMVGGCALRICFEKPDVSLVTVIGPKHTGINDTRLREVVVDNFTDYAALAYALENQDTALYCLGVYTGEDLARAMVHAGLYGIVENENPVLENKDIRFINGV